MPAFAPGWITAGWGKVNGIWYELGSAPGVTSSGEIPPHVGIHDVAALLTSLGAKNPISRQDNPQRGQKT